MSFDLSTSYGGLHLRSPVVVGACPLGADERTRLALEAAGAAAIVLPSLFEEQVVEWTEERGRLHDPQERICLNRSRRLNIDSICGSAENYLSLVNRASNQLTIPVIASLNGYTPDGWLEFAGELQEAGAAGIELNVHSPTGTVYRDPSDMEKDIAMAVTEVRKSLSVPLFIKVERGEVNVPRLARMICSGAQGLVMFGRRPEADICLDSLKLKLRWTLTHKGSSQQLISPVMQAHSSCPAISLAACGGITTGEDVAKVILAGADVAMVTSVLYREGVDVLRSLLDGFVKFMEKHHVGSLRDLHQSRPLQFCDDEERAAYVTALSARRFADSTLSETNDTTMTGDRWGHPNT